MFGGRNEEGIFASFFILLGACNLGNYRNTYPDNDYLKDTDWYEEGISYKTASYLDQRNVNFADYKYLEKFGLNREEDIKNIVMILPSSVFANKDDDYDKEIDDLADSSDPSEVQEAQEYYKNLKQAKSFYEAIAQGIKNSFFTSKDICKILIRGGYVAQNKKNYYIPEEGFLDYSNEILDTSKKLHQGNNVEGDIDRSIQINLNKKHIEEQKQRNQRQREADEVARGRQENMRRLKSIFGEELINSCNGKIFAALFDQDPYADRGTCVVMAISSYGGEKQWINSNEILLDGKFLFISDEHIRLNNDFLGVVVEPQQYQNALGELQTPRTIKILKFQ